MALLLWTLALPINLFIVYRMVLFVSDNSFGINMRGAISLALWSIVLGPFFTVLTITYLCLERFE